METSFPSARTWFHFTSFPPAFSTHQASSWPPGGGNRKPLSQYQSAAHPDSPCPAVHVRRLWYLPAGGQRDSTVIKEVEPDKRDKGYAWHTAIGLQAVDGGITFEEANALLQVYYEENPTHNASGRTEGDYEVP